MSNDGVEIVYKSSDLYFCAYICSCDVPLEKTEFEEGSKKKVVFSFNISPAKLQELKTGFFSGNGVVRVQKYVQQLKTLKSLCFV
jgi:hypothetical protein